MTTLLSREWNSLKIEIHAFFDYKWFCIEIYPKGLIEHNNFPLNDAVDYARQYAEKLQQNLDLPKFRTALPTYVQNGDNLDGYWQVSIDPKRRCSNQVVREKWAEAIKKQFEKAHLATISTMPPIDDPKGFRKDDGMQWTHIVSI